MSTAADKLFQRAVRAFVPVARLNRRVPLDGKKLSPASFNKDVLDGMKVASVSLGGSEENGQQFIERVVEDGGGKYEAHVSGPVDAVVCDGRNITSLDELQLLHTKLHPIVKNISKNGRFVMISGSEGTATSRLTPTSAGITAGLGGFTKALGKELAGKGITSNMIAVGPTAAPTSAVGIPGTLQFLLSRRSAFITNEFLRLKHPISPHVLAESDSFSDGFCVAKKRVLVTGAARGIGEYMARLFAAENAEVLLLDHPSAENNLQKLANELNASFLPLDIASKDSPSVLYESITKSFGDSRLDAVVHNAGITRDKMFRNMKSENFKAVIDVNLASVARIDEMMLTDNWQGNSGCVLGAGGRVTYLSSISGIGGIAGQTNYSCSKAGIIGYVDQLGSDLAGRGIGINAIAPGFIETEMTGKVPFLMRNVGRVINALVQSGYPADIAEAALFLSSPASSGLTGNTIRVCGGHIVGA